MVVNKKGRKGNKKIIFVSILLASTLVAGGYWRYISTRAVDPMLLYQTTSVTRGDVSRTVTGEANVRTSETTSLFIETVQTVSAIHVEVGDKVEKGQVLVEYDIQSEMAELNRRLSESSLYQQNANLNMQNIARPPSANELSQYETAIVNAEKTISDTQFEIESLESKVRAQRLRVDSARKSAGIYRDDYDDGRIDEEDYDLARTDYRVAQAELDDLATQLEAKIVTIETYEQLLKTAKERLANAQNPMEDDAVATRYAIQRNLASIQALTSADVQADLAKLIPETVSPINGSVTAVNVQEGGTAGSTGAVIVLSDKGKAVVRFEVSEFDAPQIKTGQKALITAGGIEGVIYKGTVTKIFEDAVEKENSDDNEIVVPVEITLENIDDVLKVGYTVNVELILEQRNNVLQIPLGAMVADEDGAYVYTIENSAVVRRSIEIGFSGDRVVEVLAGLSENDILIVSPADVVEYTR